MAPLAWGDAVDDTYDCVLVGDCCYGEYDVAALGATLADAHARGMHVVLAYRPRSIAKERKMLRRFQWLTLDTPKAYAVTQIQLLQLTGLAPTV